jgi:myo-inositol-1(or 4)-monophosphatase
MNDFVSVCEEAARAGGRQLRNWAGRITAREKAPFDLVSEADVASQKVIRQLLLGRYPDHDFLGEEGDSVSLGKTPYRWVVDPLDGTINYVHGLHGYCVAVSLERDGDPIAACVYDPVSDECFTAGRGGGAYLNGRKLRASGIESLSQALIVTGFRPGVQAGDYEIKQFERTLVATQSMRRLGSAALTLCYMADGRIDAFYRSVTNLWDVSAGMLILQEAGGLMTHWNGRPFDSDDPAFVAAGTTKLHAELRAILGDDPLR